jgi:hypothetical protein
MKLGQCLIQSMSLSLLEIRMNDLQIKFVIDGRTKGFECVDLSRVLGFDW